MPLDCSTIAQLYSGKCFHYILVGVSIGGKMGTLKQFLLVRFLGAALLLVGFLYAATYFIIYPAYQQVVTVSKDVITKVHEEFLLKQIDETADKVRRYFEIPREELLFLADAAQKIAARPPPNTPDNQSVKLSGEYGLRLNRERNWYQNDDDSGNVITVWGHLLNNNAEIQPRVIDHLIKYDSIFPLFETVMKLGGEKQWAYMVGADGNSYLRLTPWVDMASEFDRLYPGHNEVDFWHFFFPGITAAWKENKQKFTLSKESNGITHTLPYEDAAGSGIIISMFQPLFDSQSNFDGVAAIDLNIKAIVDFIGALEVGKSGLALMVKDDGTVLSLSSRTAERLGLSDQKLKALGKEKPLRIMEANLFDSTIYDFQKTLGEDRITPNLKKLACLGQNVCTDRMYILTEELPSTWLYDGATVSRGSYKILFVLPEKELFSLASLVENVVSQSTQQAVGIFVPVTALVLALLVFGLLTSTRRIKEALSYLENSSHKVLEEDYELPEDKVGFKELENVNRAFSEMVRRVNQRSKDLQESREVYRSLVETTNQGIQEIDAKGNILFCNEVMCAVLGYSSEELLKMNVSDLLIEEDRQAFKDALRYLVAEQPAPTPYYNHNETKDGQVIEVETRWEYKYDEDRNVIGFVSSISDVTEISKARRELEASEARFKDVVSCSSDWVWELDEEGRFTFASETVREHLGYTPDELIGKSAFDLMSPEEADRVGKVYEKIIEERRPFSGMLNNNIHKDGTLVVLESSGKPIFSPDGSWLGYRGADRNITGLRKAYIELERAKEEAEKANKAKSEFLASMSHDLRTPLNAIMGFSDMMRHKAFGPLGNEQYEEYAEDIHNSGSLLVSLINDVLDLSKIEAGKYDLKDEPISVPSIVDVSIRQLTTMASISDVTLTSNIASSFPHLLGDERVLIQILNNLVSNAIKFTPSGGMVSVSATLNPENNICISVKDTGIGLSEEGIVKALKPFEQAEGHKPREYDSTGLGLHLCVNFMNLFGGSLEMDSVIDNGTTVQLQFPQERTILNS